MKPIVLSFLVLGGIAVVTASCTDPERCRIGTEECVCNNGACEAGLVCVTSENLCVATSGVACEDSCFFEWNGDGVCDDGGPDSRFAVCSLGTDCTDCGPRRHPCVNPEFPTFCPETPGVGVEQCWEANADCDTITVCPGDTGPSACLVGFRYDCVAETCVANSCAADRDFPVFCDFEPDCATSGECCFPTNSDCRTATRCSGAPLVCNGRTAQDARQIELQCGATPLQSVCVIPQ